MFGAPCTRLFKPIRFVETTAPLRDGMRDAVALNAANSERDIKGPRASTGATPAWDGLTGNPTDGEVASGDVG